MKKTLQNKNLLFKWFDIICFNTIMSSFAMLHRFCQKNSKLRKLLRNIRSQMSFDSCYVDIDVVFCKMLVKIRFWNYFVFFSMFVKVYSKYATLNDFYQDVSLTISQMIKNRYKTIIWIQISTIMKKLYVVLCRILQFDVVCIYAKQTITKKYEIQRLFNENSNRTMILIIIYDAADFEINFQKLCFHVHFFEQFLNQFMQNQILTRCRRFDNFNNVINVFEYYIKNIICSQQMIRNLKKYISKIAINFNKNIKNDVNDITLRNYVIHNERMILIIDFRIINLNFFKLKSNEFIRFVFDQKKTSNHSLIQKWICESFFINCVKNLSQLTKN